MDIPLIYTARFHQGIPNLNYATKPKRTVAELTNIAQGMSAFGGKRSVCSWRQIRKSGHWSNGENWPEAACPPLGTTIDRQIFVLTQAASAHDPKADVEDSAAIEVGPVGNPGIKQFR